MKPLLILFSILLSSCITYEASISNCREKIFQYFRDNESSKYWEVVTTKDYKKFTYFYDSHEVYFIDNFESCSGPNRAD